MLEKRQHLPVLAEEVVQAFREQKTSPTHFFEGTFGRGGHTRLLLDAFPQARVTSCDRDSQAIESGRVHFLEELNAGRLTLIHGDYRDFKQFELNPYDGALVDLGVSSPQLDDESRGFSFSKDGPLDMRMDQRQKLTAQEIVNTWDDKDLVDLFRSYGEVFKPFRVVNRIMKQRKEEPFTTTRQLASLIEVTEGWRPYKKMRHPATLYFQALRIAVNEELGGLQEFVREVILNLQSGGRAVLISFHSLEDRIVKNVFRGVDKQYGHIVNKRVIIPSEKELETNPRSRSSKMRVFERG